MQIEINQIFAFKRGRETKFNLPILRTKKIETKISRKQIRMLIELEKPANLITLF